MAYQCMPLGRMNDFQEKERCRSQLHGWNMKGGFQQCDDFLILSGKFS